MHRYEQWTAPEYYKTADSNFMSNEEKRNKAKALESRREKLKKLLTTEKEQYAKELEGRFSNFMQTCSCYVPNHKVLKTSIFGIG